MSDSLEILEKFSGIDPHFQRFLRDKRIFQKISPEIPENFSGIFSQEIPKNISRIFLRKLLRNSQELVTNFKVFLGELNGRG